MSRPQPAKAPRPGNLPAPPEPLYPCSLPGCREDRTWPAEDLAWSNGRPETVEEDGLALPAIEAGWYCPVCSDENDIERDGPRLTDVLAAARAQPAKQLIDDAQLVAALDDETGNRARAVDQVACRILERVTGITQSPSYNTRGPLPDTRVKAVATIAHAKGSGHTEGLRDVTLSPILAARLAFHLADHAEILHHAQTAAPASPQRRQRHQRRGGSRRRRH